MLDNLVRVTGRLARNAELKTTQNGISYTQFTLMARNDRKGRDGEYHSEAIDCVAYRKTAELISQYTAKGSKISVEGYIHSSNYTDQNGQTHYTQSVVVTNWRNEDNKETTNQRRANNGLPVNNQPAQNGQPNTPAPNPYPQGQQAPVQGTTQSSNVNPQGQTTQQPQSNNTPAPADPFADSGNTVDISDDDLPF